MKKWSLVLWTILTSSLFLVPQVSHAGTITTTFQVTANILGNCTAASATNMAFGAYDPSSPTPLAQTSTISVTCVLLTSYTIALNAGTTTGGTLAQRLMNNTTTSGHTLPYNLYTTTSHATVWGDGSGSTVTQTFTSGISATPTVYGQIPAGQTSSGVGNYSDTITATITF